MMMKSALIRIIKDITLVIYILITPMWLMELLKIDRYIIDKLMD